MFIRNILSPLQSKINKYELYKLNLFKEAILKNYSNTFRALFLKGEVFSYTMVSNNGLHIQKRNL